MVVLAVRCARCAFGLVRAGNDNGKTGSLDLSFCSRFVSGVADVAAVGISRASLAVLVAFDPGQRFDRKIGRKLC